VRSQGFDSGAELPELFPPFVGQIRRGVAKILGGVEHAPDLATGSFRDAEEIRKVRVRSAFETFGNVVHNGLGSASDLVLKAEVASRRTADSKINVGLLYHNPGRLPNPKIFKCARSRHVFLPFPPE